MNTLLCTLSRESGVSAIAFHPTRHMAVSSSYGGDFKPMTAATFSADGSVLAVAAEAYITLWDPEKNVLVAVIGESLEDILPLYGELPEFDLKRNQIQPVPFVPSERPWETIFSGPSHSLPPLTKLCSSFLESLLQKRTAAVE
ncbi:hypothetical protein U1Q18_000183 [Sarracenia purpurea var. burkii]